MKKKSRSMVWLIAAALLVGGTAAGIRAQEADQDTEDDAAVERERTVRVRAPRVAMRLGGGGWLGVSVEDVDAERAGELGLDGPRGALVESVEEESPAEEAGVQAGDVIVSFDGERVRSVAELVRLVRETPDGRSVELEVVRDRGRRTLSATIEERRGRGFGFRVGPGDAEAFELRMEELGEELSEERMEEIRARVERAREHVEELEIAPDGEGVHVFRFLGRPRLGVRLQSLSDQLAEYFGVAERGGALVASVRDGSPAASAGLRAGDVVVSFGGEEVGDPGDLVRAVREADPAAVEVTVVRRGEERTLTVELPERDEDTMSWRAAPAPRPVRARAVRPLPPRPVARPSLPAAPGPVVRPAIPAPPGRGGVVIL